MEPEEHPEHQSEGGEAEPSGEPPPVGGANVHGRDTPLFPLNFPALDASHKERVEALPPALRVESLREVLNEHPTWIDGWESLFQAQRSIGLSVDAHVSLHAALYLRVGAAQSHASVGRKAFSPENMELHEACEHMEAAGDMFAVAGWGDDARDEERPGTWRAEPIEGEQAPPDNLAARWFESERQFIEAENDAVLELPEESAIAGLTNALKEHPESARRWVLLSDTQWRHGREEDAFQSLLSSSYAHLHLAITLLEAVLGESPERQGLKAALEHMLEASAILSAVRKSGAVPPEPG